MSFATCTISGKAGPDRMIRSGRACVRRTMPISMRRVCCAGAESPAEINGRKTGRLCMTMC